MISAWQKRSNVGWCHHMAFYKRNNGPSIRRHVLDPIRVIYSGEKRTQKYGTRGPIFYTLLEVVPVSLQNSFHVRPVETQGLHDDISALVILFMYLFIYWFISLKNPNSRKWIQHTYTMTQTIWSTSWIHKIKITQASMHIIDIVPDGRATTRKICILKDFR